MYSKYSHNLHQQININIPFVHIQYIYIILSLYCIFCLFSCTNLINIPFYIITIDYHIPICNTSPHKFTNIQQCFTHKQIICKSPKNKIKFSHQKDYTKIIYIQIIQNQMTSQIHSISLEHYPKLQPIYKKKHPLKRLSFNIVSNHHLSKKLPFTKQKVQTQRIYLHKCKTQGIQRISHEHKMLLNQSCVNEFMDTEESKQLYSADIKKIGKKYNHLNKIQIKIYKRMQQTIPSKNPIASKTNIQSQKILQNNASLPPIQIKNKHNVKQFTINEEKDKQSQRSVQSFNGMITFSPYKLKNKIIDNNGQNKKQILTLN